MAAHLDFHVRSKKSDPQDIGQRGPSTKVRKLSVPVIPQRVIMGIPHSTMGYYGVLWVFKGIWGYLKVPSGLWGYSWVYWGIRGYLRVLDLSVLNHPSLSYCLSTIVFVFSPAAESRDDISPHTLYSRRNQLSVLEISFSVAWHWSFRKHGSVATCQIFSSRN